MGTAPGASGFSDLEREFELEMDGSDSELDEELDEEAADEEFESEYEDRDFEAALEMESAGSGYAERLQELANREFESESEVDQALNEVLNDIEQEFFFGSLKKKWSKFKKGGLGKLVSKGLKMAAGQIPAVQALKGVTSLARGNLKGMVTSLAKAGLSSVVPGGGVAVEALKNLGFGGEGEVGEGDQEAWNNVVDVAREAYEHLAENLHERANEPLEASRLASDAFKAGLSRVSQGVRKVAPRDSVRSKASGAGRRRRIRLRRGEVLIIECE